MRFHVPNAMQMATVKYVLLIQIDRFPNSDAPLVITHFWNCEFHLLQKKCPADLSLIQQGNIHSANGKWSNSPDWLYGRQNCDLKSVITKSFNMIFYWQNKLLYIHLSDRPVVPFLSASLEKILCVLTKAILKQKVLEHYYNSIEFNKGWCCKIQ